MLALDELGEARFGTYQLVKLAIFKSWIRVSQVKRPYRMLQLAELGEASFRTYKFGNLREAIFRQLDSGELGELS